MMNPKEVINLDSQIEEDKKETLLFIDEITNKYQYKSLENFDNLQLTPEEIRKMLYTNPKKIEANLKFYINERLDKEKVKIIARTGGMGELIAADIFSPAFHDNHTANHDFVRSEFESVIKNALELNKYNET